MPKIIVANWKMHGNLNSIDELLAKVRPALYPLEIEVVVCPSFPYLGHVHRKLKLSGLIKLGAQDLSAYAEGAYTGEVAVSMLKEVGCQYVLVGHSECRMYHHETNTSIAAKLEQAMQAEILPILCVGESLAEREECKTNQVIKQQLAQALAPLKLRENTDVTPFMIAYEPVWAIGTGVNANNAQIRAVHIFIRKTLVELLPGWAKFIPILYGGSVKAKNAAEILALAEVDGALVGGASLIAEEFIKICEEAHAASV